MSETVHGPGIPPSDYPAPQYPAPHYPAHYGHQSTRTNGFSIAALVLGILWVSWIGSILAVIFGHIAKNQIERSNGTQSGRGMAIAGLVLGWIGVGTLLLFIVLTVIGAASTP
jgi:hypothetical protein